MHGVITRIIALLSIWGSTLAIAAMEEGAVQSEPAPTVDVVWVFVFLAVFVGLCLWFGIYMWRANKRDQASSTPPGPQA